jgi:putative oxidoreductase
MEYARIFVDELHSLEWIGILVARVAVGTLFFISGCAKLFVLERREEMRRTLIEAHVPFPNVNAAFVSTVEFVCGLLLILGAVTPLASASLMGVMIVAISTTAIRNIKATSPVEWLSAFLYLPEVLYLMILLWLFLSGPGWLSIDQLFRLQKHL